MSKTVKMIRCTEIQELKITHKENFKKIIIDFVIVLHHDHNFKSFKAFIMNLWTSVNFMEEWWMASGGCSPLVLWPGGSEFLWIWTSHCRDCGISCQSSAWKTVHSGGGIGPRCVGLWSFMDFFTFLNILCRDFQSQPLQALNQTWWRSFRVVTLAHTWEFLEQLCIFIPQELIWKWMSWSFLRGKTRPCRRGDSLKKLTS